jgi:hypothetical protein
MYIWSRSERIAVRDHYLSCETCAKKLMTRCAIDDLDDPAKAAISMDVGRQMAELDSAVSPFEDPESQPSDDWMMKGG